MLPLVSIVALDLLLSLITRAALDGEEGRGVRWGWGLEALGGVGEAERVGGT